MRITASLHRFNSIAGRSPVPNQSFGEAAAAPRSTHNRTPRRGMYSTSDGGRHKPALHLRSKHVVACHFHNLPQLGPAQMNTTIVSAHASHPAPAPPYAPDDLIVHDHCVNLRQHLVRCQRELAVLRPPHPTRRTAVSDDRPASSVANRAQPSPRTRLTATRPRLTRFMSSSRLSQF